MYTLQSDPGEPKNLEEAFNGPDKAKWYSSIKDEVQNFLDRDAWKEVPLHKVVKEGRKPFMTKTVFKIKEEQEGSTRYKSRIVSLGYDMIPGKDYTDSYSPVATDSSTRIAFGISLYIMNRKHRERTLRKKIGEMAWKRKTDHAKLFC
jgi:hypothetical protein